MREYSWLIFGVLLITAVGCGGPAVPGIQPPDTPAAASTATPLLQVPEGAGDLVRSVRDALATRLEQADDRVDIVDVEAAEWPTAAMGCPEPDKMYARVVTSGYIVRLRTAGRTYEAHVSADGSIVFCDAGEESSNMQIPSEATSAVTASKRDLASRVGVEASEVEVVQFETVEWSDASLGCPEPGRMYAQVITPGYRIVLRAGGQTYEYHTNQGDRAVLCTRGTEGAAPGNGQGLRQLQDLRSAVERARTDLAERLEIQPEQTSVAEADLVGRLEQTAPCPQADQLPGGSDQYQITLRAGGETYVYRVQGDDLVFCAQ